MPTFSPSRLVPYPDQPLVSRQPTSWRGGLAVQSHASWSSAMRRVGVNVWLAAEGDAGESAAPVGAKMFLGGRDHEISDDDAYALICAGWGDCVTGARLYGPGF